MFVISVLPAEDVMSISIAENGRNTSGDGFNFTCTIQTISGFSSLAVATWTPRMGEFRGNSNVSVLQFNPLRTSHAGNYSCRGRLDVTVGESPLQHEAHTQLKVKSKNPT